MHLYIANIHLYVAIAVLATKICTVEGKNLIGSQKQFNSNNNNNNKTFS